MRMENSDSLSRDSQQAPPAYDAHVDPPSDGTRTNSLPHDPPVESPQLLAPGSSIGRSHTRRRSPSRTALQAIKSVFTIGGGKDSKHSTESSRSPPPSPGVATSEYTGTLLTLAGVGKMTIQLASPQAVQAFQGPSPNQTPRSEAPSSPAYPSLHPSTTKGNMQSPEGYFAPPRRVTTLATDDQLRALKNFDTQFLIDDSGSMRLSTSTVATGKTHWQEVNNVLSNIVEKCAEFDENGVDVFFFNSSLVGQFNGTNIKNPDEIMNLFKARYQAGIRGSTPTAEALDLIIAPYLRECERHAEDLQFPKPRNIIVMTDGAANNNKLLKQNLISYARRLDMIKAPPHQIGVQFFQVGNVEGVDEFLNYLDNAMSEENECRDFIDTKSSEDMGSEGLTARRVLTTVLGGVNRSKSIVTPYTTEYDLGAKNERQHHRKREPKKRDDRKERDRDGRKEGKRSQRKPHDHDGKTQARKKRGKDGKSREHRRERDVKSHERERERELAKSERAKRREERERVRA